MKMQDKVGQIAERMTAANLVFGHGTANAFDEACWLVSSSIGLDPDFPTEAFSRELTREEQARIDALAQARIGTRKPLAYLLGEAWLAGLSFEVDENVLVPRSPLAELIVTDFEPWLGSDRLQRAVDVGTGSGCLAIALAHYWPEVRVDALDISASALALARRNAERHGVADRVQCLQSDLLDRVAGRRYDLILANPPYVPSASMARLPAEFRHEPELGLAAGLDGLDLVRRLLRQAGDHLTEHGILVCEVGEAAEALQALLEPAIEPVWLEFEHGGDGVFLLDFEACRAAGAYLVR
ncbi:MAG: 50S ribosomal protein L3 N(5)-glutamine methyltransferase [Wenzhouxiangella sp.]|jgi:ribosomal protein L3 glutamine methyltransferase|nr:50S ribosomal protein L3 N(5)-glutamine methyltransferase [Wenzhouxiangella sp.]